jgi:hypothetical protein
MALVKTCAPSDRLPSAAGSPGGADGSAASEKVFLDEAEVRAFYEARHVVAPLPSHGVLGACTVRHVPAGAGAAAGDASRDEATIVCHQTKIEARTGRGSNGQKLTSYRRFDYAVGHVVRGGRLVKVLDEPVLLDQMDKFDLEDGPIFELAVVAVGGRLAVREPEPGACAVAYASLAEAGAKAGDDASALFWVRFDRDLLDRLCRAAGVVPSASPRKGSSPANVSF